MKMPILCHEANLDERSQFKMSFQASHLSIVLFAIFMQPLSIDATVQCFIGSEATVTTAKIHYRQCKYACGIYERFFDDTHLYDLNELYYDCLPKSFDQDGICESTKDTPSTIRYQSSWHELTTLAPETDWDTAWKVATGPIGKVMCCNLPETKGKPNGCEPISYYRQPHKCLAYYDKSNQFHIWRMSTNEETASCEAAMYFRNGRVYRHNGPNSFGRLCPVDDYCREINNTAYVVYALDKKLNEEDRRLHSTDSAIVCCANIQRGTEFIIPDDPYTRMQCKLKGSEEIVGYQQGAKCPKSKPRMKYNENAEYETNFNKIKDEL